MSHRREKRIRTCCKGIYSARAAGRQDHVEVFLGALEGLRATEAEIKRAVAVLLKSKRVMINALAKEAALQSVGTQSASGGIPNAVPVQG